MLSHAQPKDLKIKVVNIVTKSLLIPPFSLSLLFSDFPPASNFPGNVVLLKSNDPKSKTNFSIFQSGAVISRGSRSIQSFEANLSWLRSFLLDYQVELGERYEITNIVSVATLSLHSFDLSILASYLPNCSYDPSPMLFATGHEHLVNVVTFHFSGDRKAKPRRTALIFPTGNITLTGFNSFPDLENHAVQLSSLLQQISEKHPEVIR